MYTPPPPPQPSSIVQYGEPPKTLEQLMGSYQTDGFNINCPQEASTFQEPVEPEKPSDLEKASAINENFDNIAGPIADALEAKRDAEENLEKSKELCAPGYAGCSDPPEPSQETTQEQKPESGQNTAPKQAEAATPSENNGESGSSTPDLDDGYDYYNGIKEIFIALFINREMW